MTDQTSKSEPPLSGRETPVHDLAAEASETPQAATSGPRASEELEPSRTIPISDSEPAIETAEALLSDAEREALEAVQHADLAGPDPTAQRHEAGSEEASAAAAPGAELDEAELAEPPRAELDEAELAEPPRAELDEAELAAAPLAELDEAELDEAYTTTPPPAVASEETASAPSPPLAPSPPRPASAVEDEAPTPLMPPVSAVVDHEEEEAAPASVEPDEMEAPDSVEPEEVETIDEVDVATLVQVAPPPPAMSRAPAPPQAASDGPQRPGSDGVAPGNAESAKPPPPKRSAKPALPQAKTRRKPWWETLFGDDFSRAHRPPTPSQLSREVDFISERLDLQASQVVLDLGCGQGEHAVEMAKRRISVVGYDLSVFQLAMAGDLAQMSKQKINFLQGDMREMAFDSMFDAVLCWGTSFGYFEEEKNMDVARRMLFALKPGGRLMLQVMNRDFAAQDTPTNVWFEGDGCVCMDDVELDWITNRLKVKRSIILDDGRSKELHYSLRLYSLSEVGKLLHDVGFKVTSVSGDVSTPGAFFGPASPSIIMVAVRP